MKHISSHFIVRMSDNNFFEKLMMRYILIAKTILCDKWLILLLLMIMLEI